MKGLKSIRVLRIVLLVIMCLAFTAGVMLTFRHSEAKTEEGHIDVAVSFSESEQAWTVAALQDMLNHFKNSEIRYEWRSAEGSFLKQKEDIRELLEQDPEYLVLLPVRSIGLGDILKDAAAAGTRIILFNGRVSGLEDSDVYYVFESDPYLQGSLCVKMLTELLGEGKKNIIELQSENGSSTLRERSTGFREELCKYDGYEIAAVLRAGNERIGAYKQIMDYLSEPSRKVDAIFAHNDEAGMGALAALEKLGMKDKIAVVSVGGIQDVKQVMVHTQNYLCLDVCPYVGEQLTQIISEREISGNVFKIALQEYDHENYEEMAGY